MDKRPTVFHATQRVTISDIEAFLRPNKRKRATRTVPTPPNLSSTSLQDRSQSESLSFVISNALGQLKEKDVNAWRVAYLQREATLRISEVLLIDWQDITQGGDVLIHAAKGGLDKVVGTGELREYMLKCRRHLISPFAGMTYTYIYRLYISVGLQNVRAGKRLNSVTHIFRHAAAGDIRECAMDEQLITQRLSHRSLKSRNWYGKN